MTAAIKSSLRRILLAFSVSILLGSIGAFAADSEIVNVLPAGRTVANFDRAWRFSKSDLPNAAVPAFDDSSWRLVNVPHDWSNEGPFGPEYASGNGYAPGGVAWYRKHFRLDSAATNKIVAVEFDGIYQHSEVWINGHFAGGRPYGYASFECELTPFLKFGNAENVIAVRVDHSRYADSRWYTGSGIYRDARLRVTDKLHLATWGTSLTTPKVSADSAAVRIETSVANNGVAPAKFVLESEIVAPDGGVVKRLTSESSAADGMRQSVLQETAIASPKLWSVESPQLYSLRSRVRIGETIVDESATPFGIRTFSFDANKGFSLNGVPMKLKGVCVHHDAGPLGAAVPIRVWERRLRTLKEIGVNAIRTSHNPPAPEFLDLCDRLGFLVKDEAFDEFTPAKNKWMNGVNNGQPSRYGYAENFEEWATRDIADMVRRDRNHPSIILWSIGNEIDFANDPFSHPVLGGNYHPENPPAENLVTLAKPLIAAVKSVDTTRPVTAALATVAMSDAVGLPELLDVVGYNYQEPRYQDDHAKFPKRVIFGSETSHQLSAWMAVRTNDFISGQFLWTGIDYLGEAGRWPNRGSSAGLLDICGFKKPLAWFRQSLWSDQPMVYMTTSSDEGFSGRGRFRSDESWNWQTNATVTVRCFTTCPEVALTLNGKSLGVKSNSEARDGAFVWRVPFEAGVLKAEGRRDGRTICEFTLKTAGAASRIELLPDTTQLAADGSDVCQVEFRVTDAQGVRVPDADDEVTFELNGPAEILGAGNGNLNGPVDFKAKTQRVFHGRGLVVLQSKPQSGKIVLKASSPGLEAATMTVEIK